ncbi:porin [Roseibium sp. MMSF_3544]|uniref:porin n=1 Tax=unclassified Roseibium TaxID=2629323 RepID=UPI00273F2411|nr:porin [Roseibium sp. MMSF_3544]
MKLKSLMLGVAAAATATTAQAADLPVAPEPVDYVRICDAYGARFYYIPGTETCLRVGGRVRAQVTINNVLDDGNWSNRDSDGYTWLTEAYLYIDARTATEFGTLRAYFTLEGQISNQVESFDMGAAYIQWGGITAGYLGSNFDIFTGQVWSGPIGRDWSDETVNQLAYTAAFGNGFSATVALEDRRARETGAYGGTRVPDLVAALAISQGWGSAQISGALHQVYPDAAFNSTNPGSEDNIGWAIGAGAVFNLPFANSGSNIFFQGFYADGALEYIGDSISASANAIAAGTVSDYTGDDTNSGYSLSSGIYIQATPTIGLALDGSYAEVDMSGTGNDVTRYAIDGSVVWEPVSTFGIGADVGYANTDVDNVGDQDELVFRVRAQKTF